MYKNQLQEVAQRSCFNLPSYGWKREGPDHAPRFKASVNFNGEIFESPGYSPTLRQAQHAAAHVALNVLSSRASKSLTARLLDETGVYKNLLQETAHKAGLNLPAYTTIRSGPGHVPVFTSTVELAGFTFTGHPAKTKKQAQKNAAIAAWSSLKSMPRLVTKQESAEDQQNEGGGEQDEAIVTRVLSSFRPQKSARQKGHHHHHHHNQHHYGRRSRNARGNKRSDDSVKSYYFTNPTTSNLAADQQQQQKISSFVDLLPPPPPRTISKILPLTSNNNTITNEQDQLHDDGIMKKPPTAFRTQTQTQTQAQTHFRNLFMGVGSSSSSSSCAQMGMLGNYSSKLKGIAPAVQIRSVIPVCAAPPPPRPPSSSSSSSSSSIKPLTTPLPLVKEEPSSSASSTAATTFTDASEREKDYNVVKPAVCCAATSLSSDLTRLQLKED